MYDDFDESERINQAKEQWLQTHEEALRFKDYIKGINKVHFQSLMTFYYSGPFGFRCKNWQDVRDNEYDIAQRIFEMYDYFIIEEWYEEVARMKKAIDWAKTQTIIEKEEDDWSIFDF